MAEKKIIKIESKKMIMANLQNIFADSKMIYNECHDKLNSIAFTLDDWSAENQESFDPELFLAKFDLVLQYSMLEVAAADYDINRNEIVFIRDLIDETDFLSFANTVEKTNVSWEDLYSFSSFDIRMLLKGVDDIMKQVCKDFVRHFATYDILTKHDYLYDIRANVIAILSGLMEIDGKMSECELRTDYLIFKMLNQIEDIKDKIRVQDSTF